jgi:hypothetical protein
MKLSKWLAAFGLVMSMPALALTQIPLPSDPIYYEPPVEQVTEEQQVYSCAQLELAINQLHPYRYSYQPNYYRDPVNQVASTVLIVETVPLNGLVSAALFTYSALMDEKEKRRTLSVEQQISALQNLKAQKHCYE